MSAAPYHILGDDDKVLFAYLWLLSLQVICGEIAWGETYEAIFAENIKTAE